MAELYTVRRDFMTLDLLLTIERGLQGQRLIEQALDMNPGLASAGAVLPHGTQVLLPDDPLPDATPAQSIVVSLFD